MKDPIEKVITVFVIISFTIMILNVSFQVFSRVFTPGLSQIWTEELTRFLFIYSVTIAAPLAMKRKMYVNIELVNFLPQVIQDILHIIIQLAVAILFSIIMIYGCQFTKLGMTQLAPTIRIPIAIIYISIPIMGALMTFYTLYNLFLYIKSIKKGGGNQ